MNHSCEATLEFMKCRREARNAVQLDLDLGHGEPSEFKSLKENEGMETLVTNPNNISTQNSPVRGDSISKIDLKDRGYDNSSPMKQAENTNYTVEASLEKENSAPSTYHRRSNTLSQSQLKASG